MNDAEMRTFLRDEGLLGEEQIEIMVQSTHSVRTGHTYFGSYQLEILDGAHYRQKPPFLFNEPK